MAISLYDASVACFLQTLGGVDGFLSRGFAHCQERNIDPNEIVEARLFDDMLPFRFQVLAVALQTSNHSLLPIPSIDYAGLQKVVTDAREALQKITPAEVNTLEGKDVVFEVRDMKLPFTAEGFLLSFSLPNFLFHATTAYDILRTKGVPLGKRDFLGKMRLKS